MCVPASYIIILAEQSGKDETERAGGMQASRQVDPKRRWTAVRSTRLPGQVFFIGDVIGGLKGPDVESWGWEASQI